MAVKTYSKPAVRNAWADDPPNGSSDLVDPGNTYADQGWQIGIKPPRQYFNWVLYYATAAVRYFCQQGISAWDAAEVYPKGAITQGSDNHLYQSKVANNTGINPTTDNGTNWGPIQGVAPANLDNSNALPTTAWVTTNFLPKGTSISSLIGTLSNGQLVQSNVTQFQGALSIGGGQITSAVNSANHLVISGVATTFNWSGQSGQPTWLLGSNDGTNFFVWNPSNFSVTNSQQLQGLTPNAGAAGNTVVIRDSSGYVYAAYLNQASGNNENPSISQVMVTNGIDNFLRKASLSALAQALAGAQSLALPGYARLPGGLILQWGRVSPSWVSSPVDVTIFFPIAFPNSFLVGFATSMRNVTQQGQAIDGSGFVSGPTNTYMTLTLDFSAGMWFAIGY